MKRELNFVIVLTGSVFTSYTWLAGAVHRVPACIFATNSCSSTLTGQTKRSVPRRIETSESSQHWWRNNRSNVPQSAKYFFGGGLAPRASLVLTPVHSRTNYRAVRRCPPPIAADLRPCADRSAVRTALVACGAAAQTIAYGAAALGRVTDGRTDGSRYRLMLLL